MRSAHRTPPAGGAFSRRFTDYAGIFFDDYAPDSAWIRERGTIHLPPLAGVRAVVLRGDVRPHPDARGLETAAPGLDVLLNGRPVDSLSALLPGPWEITLTLPPSPDPKPQSLTLTLRLTGTTVTNTLAWLGRVSGLASLQRFRSQNKNRQLRLVSIATPDGELIYDFSVRHAPYSSAFARTHTPLGLNIVGFLTADLGVGESARCMVRAADAAGLTAALVPLKLNCKNRQGDQTYAARLQADNPHDVNVVHIDPPASRDLDHHHGPAFRADKYNIGYFAWELPEFPDAWTSAFDYYDEIWTPSDFATAAIAQKSPLPVLTMPHAISFARPTETTAILRALVIKVQNVAGNEADFAALRASVADLRGTVLLTETLSRADIYALEAACDCFVSLHRSEGFGLAVAEAMYLGKPVISTDWSATSEFVNATNGCPVRAPLVTLERNHGPYAKGSTWADPDPAHAAEYMRRLFADPALGAALGAAARATIESRFSPAAIGTRYRRRLEVIATF